MNVRLSRALNYLPTSTDGTKSDPGPQELGLGGQERLPGGVRREPEGAHVGVPGFVGQQQGRREVAPKAGLRVADPKQRLVEGSVRIRIQSGPWIWNPIGSRRAKMTHKSRKKFRNFMF
jgi:hypothetical protein